MRIRTKNKGFLYHILLLVIEITIVILVSFFSLGDPEMMLNNYEAHPFESFIKSFVVVAIAMFIINLLIVTFVEFIKLILLKDINQNRDDEEWFHIHGTHYYIIDDKKQLPKCMKIYLDDKVIDCTVNNTPIKIRNVR